MNRKLSVTLIILGFLISIPWLKSYAESTEEVLKKIAGLSPDKKKAVLEEGARKEKTLYFYTSVSVADHPKIMAKFREDYPYLDTKTYRSTPDGVFTRLSTEARARHHVVDVTGTGPEQMWLLKIMKLSVPYVSPEVKAFPKGAYDPGGYWASFEVTPLVLAYNPAMVPTGNVPNNYQDLLDPKWKGKMNLGIDDYDWFVVVLDGMGKDKGFAYMKALAKQDLEFPGSSSRMRVQLMMAGQSQMAVGARARRVTEFKEKGGPVDYRMLDPYPGSPNSVALMRHAPNPHAAILFFDWLLTEKAQSFMAQKVPRMALRKGVKQIPRNQGLFDKEFVFVSPALIGPRVRETIKLYNEIFGLHKAQ